MWLELGIKFIILSALTIKSMQNSQITVRFKVSDSNTEDMHVRIYIFNVFNSTSMLAIINLNDGRYSPLLFFRELAKTDWDNF